MCVIFTKIASVNKKNNVHKNHGFINIFVFILQVLYTGLFVFLVNTYTINRKGILICTVKYLFFKNHTCEKVLKYPRITRQG